MYCNDHSCSDFDSEDEEAIKGHLAKMEGGDKKKGGKKPAKLAQDADAKVEAEAKKMWKKMSKKEQAEAEKAIEGLDTSELEDLKAEARKEVKLAQKPAKGEKPEGPAPTDAEIEAAIDEWCAENSCPDVDECASDDEECFEAAMDAFCEDHDCSDNWSGDDWSGDDVSGDEKPAPKGDKPAPKEA